VPVVQSAYRKLTGIYDRRHLVLCDVQALSGKKATLAIAGWDLVGHFIDHQFQDRAFVEFRAVLGIERLSPLIAHHETCTSNWWIRDHRTGRSGPDRSRGVMTMLSSSTSQPSESEPLSTFNSPISARNSGSEIEDVSDEREVSVFI
jgi:hypothetical protein